MKWYIIIVIVFLVKTVQAQTDGTYNIKSFGAITSNEGVSTLAIQKTIDACYAAGGGTVMIPCGEYLSSTIILKDNVTLYLSPGSRLIATKEEADYQSKGDFADTGGGNTPVLIFAMGAKNIAIKGEGEIVGQPEYYTAPLGFSEFIRDDIEAAKEAGVELISWHWKRPNVSLVFLTECENVLVENVSMLNSPFWTFHAHWVNHLKIKGVRIFSDLEKAANADGIDIDGCSDVAISDCFIETADDAICLKTTNSNGKYRSCENITVSNCILASSSCALKLGTESYGDFRRINFNNCVIKNSNRGLGIIIRDGGTASDIIFSNITMECKRRPVGWWGSADALYFVVLKRNPGSGIGAIRNVIVKNVLANIQGTSLIAGFEGMKNVENITIENFQLFMNPESLPDKRAKQGLLINNAKDISVTHTKVVWSQQNPGIKWSNAFCFNNIDNLYLDRLSCSQAPGKDLPAIQFNNINGAIVERCYASEGTSTFFKIEGKGSKNIIGNTNYLENAKRGVLIEATADRKTISFK